MMKGWRIRNALFQKQSHPVEICDKAFLGAERPLSHTLRTMAYHNLFALVFIVNCTNKSSIVVCHFYQANAGSTTVGISFRPCA